MKTDQKSLKVDHKIFLFCSSFHKKVKNILEKNFKKVVISETGNRTK